MRYLMRISNCSMRRRSDFLNCFSTEPRETRFVFLLKISWVFSGFTRASRYIHKIWIVIFLLAAILLLASGCGVLFEPRRDHSIVLQTSTHYYDYSHFSREDREILALLSKSPTWGEGIYDLPLSDDVPSKGVIWAYAKWAAQNPEGHEMVKKSVKKGYEWFRDDYIPAMRDHWSKSSSNHKVKTWTCKTGCWGAKESVETTISAYTRSEAKKRFDEYLNKHYHATFSQALCGEGIGACCERCEQSR